MESSQQSSRQVLLQVWGMWSSWVVAMSFVSALMPVWSTSFEYTLRLFYSDRVPRSLAVQYISSSFRRT
jgi:uncharacterized membrane protein YdbT with pleckstrin-like domain